MRLQCRLIFSTAQSKLRWQSWIYVVQLYACIKSTGVEEGTIVWAGESGGLLENVMQSFGVCQTTQKPGTGSTGLKEKLVYGSVSIEIGYHTSICLRLVNNS